MPTKTPYRTKQLEKLLKYLQATPGQHHTAAQIREVLSRGSQPVSTTTVYRQLEKMVEQGLVRKYVLEIGHSACYEYVGQQETCSSHFHCRCDR